MSFVNPLSSTTPSNSNQPSAQSQLVRGPNGQLQVQYIDLATGQVIMAPQGYNIVSPHIASLEDLGLLPTKEQSSTKQPTTDQTKTEEEYIPPFENDGGLDKGGFSPGNLSRDQSNNYGYIDKPGWMGFTSSLPGALGIAGKGLNAAINANNVGAVNAARDAMDVDPLSAREAIGGTIKDRQGFVGNVGIKNQAGQVNQYSVGLEAMTPSGKTTLTPDEARRRAMANPANISLTENQDESKKGLGSRIKDFVSSLFSDDEDDRGIDHFPDAPSMGTGFGSHEGSFNPGSATKYDGVSYSGQNMGLDTPSETRGTFGGRSGFGGLSDTARSEVDKGTGGLY